MEQWTYKALKSFWGKVHRWHRKTMHDRILITISRAALITVLISPWIVGPTNWIPVMISVLICCAWLTCFARVNGDLL